MFERLSLPIGIEMHTLGHLLTSLLLVVLVFSSDASFAVDTAKSANSDAIAERERLIKAIQKGGFVLLMRHSATEPGTGDPLDFKLGDCSTQRNLSAKGRDDAQKIGQALRKLNAPIGRVLNSPWCRARDTAQLAFGKSEDYEPLSSIFNDRIKVSDQSDVVKRRMGMHQKNTGKKDNLVMVTHNVNITALVNVFTEQSEIVVVKPDGCCGTRVYGTLKLSDLVRD
jgi:phosphohistidine phosphatase SixA